MARRLKDCPDLRIFSGSVIWAVFGADFGMIPGAGVHDTAEDEAVPGDFQALLRSAAHPASVRTAVNHTAVKKHR